jgi:hypothetical protein
VGLGGELWRGSFAGSDGPDWFVGDDKFASFFRRDSVEGAQALAAKHVFGQPSFSFFKYFSDANDGREAGFERGFQFEIYDVIGFAEILAAFGMSNDYMGAADGEQHGRADFAGIRAFFFPVQVLRSDCDVRFFDGLDRSAEIDIGRADNDFIAIVICDQGKKIAKEVASLVGRFVHFPVGSDEFLSHGNPFSIRYEKAAF